MDVQQEKKRKPRKVKKSENIITEDMDMEAEKMYNLKTSNDRDESRLPKIDPEKIENFFKPPFKFFRTFV